MRHFLCRLHILYGILECRSQDLEDLEWLMRPSICCDSSFKPRLALIVPGSAGCSGGSRACSFLGGRVPGADDQFMATWMNNLIEETLCCAGEFEARFFGKARRFISAYGACIAHSDDNCAAGAGGGLCGFNETSVWSGGSILGVGGGGGGSELRRSNLLLSAMLRRLWRRSPTAPRSQFFYVCFVCVGTRC
mmetsp:Transcript_19330/g.53669  ORF Transcript_19330/g.53669 Transcript_19330/m.53669 type:complete len:192 (+) Transcript_19330:709-1284(+)